MAIPSIQESQLIYEQAEIEKLIEQAKILYPIGTEFKSAFEGDKCTIADHDFEWITQIGGSRNAIQSSNGGWVYHDGVWAEIINSSEEPKFEVGDLVTIPNVQSLGEIHQFWPNIPYRIDRVENDGTFITMLSHIRCGMISSRFRLYQPRQKVINNYNIY